MKKGVVLFGLLLLISFSLVIAQEDTACDEGDESCKIKEALSCLNDKIDDKGCSSLSSEERVFSLLAVGECRTEVKSDSKFRSDIYTF